MNANSVNVGRYTFAARDTRPKNGNTNTKTPPTIVTRTHGPMNRSRGQCVSSPMLPYQITRYWPKVR